MDRVMMDYYTPENIGKLLDRCLAAGINTWQTSADEKVDQALENLRNRGGDIQWIFLASSPHLEDANALKEIIRRNKPIAVMHHGGVSDGLWRAGQIEKAHDFTKRVRDLGVMAGLSAHNPAVIRHAEEQGWNLDLYMTCFYRVSRSTEEIGPSLEERRRSGSCSCRATRRECARLSGRSSAPASVSRSWAPAGTATAPNTWSSPSSSPSGTSSLPTPSSWGCSRAFAMNRNRMRSWLCNSPA